VWIYTGDKLAQFHGNILNLSENIAKCFREGYFFEPHCIGPHTSEASKGAHELNRPTEVKALYFRGPFSFMGPFTCFHLEGAHRSEL